MGEAKLRKKIFLEQHPWCCFCGGDAPALTEDHQPARIFFRDRIWPEGYVFPACEPCNQVSRDAENLLSILVGDFSENSSRVAYRKRIASVSLNYPSVIPSLLDISVNEKRKAMRNRFVQLQPGQTYAQQPMVSLDRKFWLPHLEIVGIKLMLALHYQAFGVPLPTDGCIWLDVKTNADNLQEDWFRSVRDMTGRLAFPIRARKSLLDQFTIQWDRLEGHHVAMFLITLQKRVIFTGLTTAEPELHVFPDDRRLHKPFKEGPAGA